MDGHRACPPKTPSPPTTTFQASPQSLLRFLTSPSTSHLSCRLPSPPAPSSPAGRRALQSNTTSTCELYVAGRRPPPILPLRRSASAQSSRRRAPDPDIDAHITQSTTAFVNQLKGGRDQTQPGATQDVITNMLNKLTFHYDLHPSPLRRSPSVSWFRAFGKVLPSSISAARAGPCTPFLWSTVLDEKDKEDGWVVMEAQAF